VRRSARGGRVVGPVLDHLHDAEQRAVVVVDGRRREGDVDLLAVGVDHDARVPIQGEISVLDSRHVVLRVGRLGRIEHLVREGLPAPPVGIEGHARHLHGLGFRLGDAGEVLQL